MNVFGVTGYVRDNPASEIVEGKCYYAFVIQSDESSLMVPIYVNADKVKKVNRTVKLGALVEVQGKLVSQELIRDGKVYIRLYLQAINIRRIASPKVKFSSNMVISKYLNVVDENDLLKTIRNGEK